MIPDDWRHARAPFEHFLVVRALDPARASEAASVAIEAMRPAFRETACFEDWFTEVSGPTHAVVLLGLCDPLRQILQHADRTGTHVSLCGMNPTLGGWAVVDGRDAGRLDVDLAAAHKGFRLLIVLHEPQLLQLPPSVEQVTRVALDAPIALPAYPTQASDDESDGLTDARDEAFRVRSKVLAFVVARHACGLSGWRSPLRLTRDCALRLHAMPIEEPLEVLRALGVFSYLTDPADADVLEAMLKKEDPHAQPQLSIAMAARLSTIAQQRRLSASGGRRGSAQISPEDVEVGLTQVPPLYSWAPAVDLEAIRSRVPWDVGEMQQPACGSKDEPLVEWVEQCYAAEREKLKTLLAQVRCTLLAPVLLEGEKCLLDGVVPWSWRCLSFPSQTSLGQWVDLLEQRVRFIQQPASEVLLPGLFDPARIFKAPQAEGFGLEMTTGSAAPLKYDGLYVTGMQVDCAKLDDRHVLQPAKGMHPLPVFHWHDLEKRRMSVTVMQTLPVTFRILREQPCDDLPKARVPIDSWWRARGVLCCLA